MSAFPDTDKKLSILASDAAVYPKCVTQIAVAALIERATQSNPWLN